MIGIPGDGWTDERVAALKEKWALSWSAAQISRHLGGVSRSGVIGKVHRLGLNNRARASAPKATAVKRTAYLESEAQRDRARRSHQVPRVKGAVDSLPLPKPAVVAVAQVFPKICGLPTALLERADGQCHFPINEPSSPNFHYCTNERAGPGAEYCVAHAKVMGSHGTPSRSDEWYEQRRDWAMKNPTSPLGRGVIAYFAKRDAA